MASAAQAAELPVLTKPADQTSTVGVTIPLVTIHGERLEKLKATGLPQGLTLERESATEATITGTPTHPKRSKSYSKPKTKAKKRRRHSNGRSIRKPRP